MALFPPGLGQQKSCPVSGQTAKVPASQNASPKCSWAASAGAGAASGKGAYSLSARQAQRARNNPESQRGAPRVCFHAALQGARAPLINPCRPGRGAPLVERVYPAKAGIPTVWQDVFTDQAGQHEHPHRAARGDARQTGATRATGAGRPATGSRQLQEQKSKDMHDMAMAAAKAGRKATCKSYLAQKNTHDSAVAQYAGAPQSQTRNTARHAALTELGRPHLHPGAAADGAGGRPQAPERGRLHEPD